MGVPGFVAWLRNYCKDAMILKNLSTKVKTLYIDGNCLIHPKCFEVLEYCKGNNDNIDKLEDIMFKRICKFIDYLVDYVNPEQCYFAVDGVAPVAKINQQRKRRYRAVDDVIMKDNLKIKHKLDTGIKWSNTVITPGTDFMERLHKHLLKHFKNKKNTVKYIYSSYHTPGEGEHKILSDIRKKKTDDTVIIYGLDADLFFLAMSSQKNNLYLLREETQFVNGKPIKSEIFDIINDVAEEMRFVSIDITKQFYDEQIKQIFESRLIDYNKIEGFSSWNDFIFICYFLGNDFLPHFPSIDIHKSGLDIVIDCYVDVVAEMNPLVNLIQLDNNDKVEINSIFLFEFLRKLANREDEYFVEILPEYNHNRSKRRCFATDDYSRELWQIDNMKFEIEDPIKLGTGSPQDYKFRYYEHYFGVSENYQEHVDLMSYMYLEGLMWVTQYYYKKCPDWKWQYPFTHAPFISDVFNYLNKTNFDINKIKFQNSECLKPCVQLVSVLPPSCSDIIPEKYAKYITDINSPIIDMFPTRVELDMINKDQYWMCIPMLPYLDIDRILDLIKDIKLSPKDEIKNQELDDFVI